MVSLGIYAITIIFIYVLIPGFIVRRFFYHGEFSKQINHSTNVFVHLIYSSFVGLITILVFISLLNCFDKLEINLDNFLTQFDKKFISIDSEKVTPTDFKGTTKDIYKYYFPFILSLYVFSGTIGFFTSKIIILFNWDTRFKFLRFKNNWHYIFSGKIFKFKKYSEHSLENTLKVKYTFVDVLVAEESDKPSLYSGLLADYDLCSENINKIERIHLLKATRYKKVNNNTAIKNIPGNLFTIIGDKILNINCTYVFYNEDEIQTKKFNSKKYLLITSQIITVIAFFVSLIILLFSFKIFKNDFLNSLIEKGFWYKILLLFTINIFLGLFTPFTINLKDKKVEFIGGKAFVLKIILLIIFGAVLYFIY
ncbi:hypothetical protein NHF50_05230 [Flavobacterium sp. NRK F10]|uniref:hypothetical protein n=1 Tax=Flavobacterium sp. NRK F10 TaxID=2954931 RepID=UPI00209121EF|nr:hypothetical protein [Flavobacterium sp. NRK F10]MCO6174442.1 hypothetical protein [Flavobacterium sp. NRK F10]